MNASRIICYNVKLAYNELCSAVKSLNDQERVALYAFTCQNGYELVASTLIKDFDVDPWATVPSDKNKFCLTTAIEKGYPMLAQSLIDYVTTNLEGSRSIKMHLQKLAQIAPVFCRHCPGIAHLTWLGRMGVDLTAQSANVLHGLIEAGNAEGVDYFFDLFASRRETHNRTLAGLPSIAVMMTRALGRLHEGTVYAVMRGMRRVQRHGEYLPRAVSASELLLLYRKLREMDMPISDVGRRWPSCQLDKCKNTDERIDEINRAFSKFLNDLKQDGFYITGNVMGMARDLIDLSEQRHVFDVIKAAFRLAASKNDAAVLPVVFQHGRFCMREIEDLMAIVAKFLEKKNEHLNSAALGELIASAEKLGDSKSLKTSIDFLCDRKLLTKDHFQNAVHCFGFSCLSSDIGQQSLLRLLDYAVEMGFDTNEIGFDYIATKIKIKTLEDDSAVVSALLQRVEKKLNDCEHSLYSCIYDKASPERLRNELERHGILINACNQNGLPLSQFFSVTSNPRAALALIKAGLPYTDQDYKDCGFDIRYSFLALFAEEGLLHDFLSMPDAMEVIKKCLDAGTRMDERCPGGHTIKEILEKNVATCALIDAYELKEAMRQDSDAKKEQETPAYPLFPSRTKHI